MIDPQENIELEGRGQSDFWFAYVDLQVIKDRTLSPCDKAVYSVICAHANIQTRACPLKIKTIALEANCSERSVQLSLKALAERGVIERTERFENGKQKASVFRIVGHRAACYMGAESAPIVETCTPMGEKNDTPSLREPNTYENKDYSPSERGNESPETEPTDGDLPVSEAPEAMRSTANYLLLNTGRKGLQDEEISALRKLNSRDFPAVVQKQIDIAIERFPRLGRDLRTLTFVYILECLKDRPPTRPLSGNKSSGGGKAAPPRKDYSDLNI